MKNWFYLGFVALLLAGCASSDFDIPARFVPVQGIELNRSQMNLVRADTSRQLFATLIPGNATEQGIEWSSSDPDLVIVNTAGRLTAVAATSSETPVTITAMSREGGFTASCEVFVVDSDIILRDQRGTELTSIVLPLTIGATPTYTFRWEVIAANTIGQETIWKVAEGEAQDVVTVNNNGQVTVIAESAASTNITITSVVDPNVTITVPVQIEYVPVLDLSLNVDDILLSVNVMDTTNVAHTGIQNFYDWKNGTLERQTTSQDRHLFIQKERPEHKRDIVVYFNPSIPSNQIIIWEYLDPKGQGWCATGTDDDTGKALKRPVRKIVNGEPATTPEGFPIYELTIPKGGDMLPNGGWAAWSLDNLAKVTLRAKSSQDQENIYADINIEVYDFGKSSASNITTGETAAAGATTAAGKAIDGDPIWKDVTMEYKLWTKPADIWDETGWTKIPVFFTTSAPEGVSATQLKRSSIYVFRYTVPRYTMPYITLNTTSTFRPINQWQWDVTKPIGEQSVLYTSGWSAFHERFFYYYINATGSATIIRFRTTVLASNPGTTFYPNANVFPYYQSSKNGTSEWMRVLLQGVQ